MRRTPQQPRYTKTSAASNVASASGNIGPFVMLPGVRPWQL
jgi:hypothetical protein